MVVAMIDGTLDPSVLPPAEKIKTNVVPNLGFDCVDKDVDERDGLDHHRAVASGEDASSEGEDELGHHTSSLMSSVPLRLGGSYVRHEEH
jgi:hypothetical protein